jgi:hypothetical protein
MVKRSKHEPHLPMPYTGQRGGFSRAEWDEYRRRRAAHLTLFPDYDAGWRRPDDALVFAVWDSCGLPDERAMLPAIRLSADERRAVSVTLRQALVVALSSAVLAGERGQMLTINRVFDALAAGWSDHYRATTEAGRARLSYEMRAETVRASWRDLLRNGINLSAIWETVKSGVSGLYTTERVPERGYTVKLSVGNSKLAQFRDATADYRRSILPGRLLLAADPVPQRPTSREIAGEWSYNVVISGARGHQLMDTLEETRVYLDVPEFLKTTDALDQEAREIQEQLLQPPYKVDVTLSPARPRGGGRSALQWGMKHLKQRDVPAVKALVERHRRATGHLAQITSVYAQVHDHAADDLLEIRAGMMRGINRRYVPRHFWPLEVTGKDREDVVVDGGTYDVEGYGEVEIEVSERSSRRGRWFKAASTVGYRARDRWIEEYGGSDEDPRMWNIQPLVGFDVSASQVQILSVFLGMTELEAQVTQRPHKDIMAEILWARDQDERDAFKAPGFSGEDDELLKRAGKTAVMTRIYGSRPAQIARTLRSAPWDFGPGLGDAQNLERAFARAGLQEMTEQLLPACEAIARRLCRERPYQGFVFRDPYDGAPVRWNPVRIVRKPITSAKTKLYVNLPVGKPNSAGDYPVDAAKLGRVILPCLVHTLDAAFASFVVEALHRRGVRDVVSVHDCWMVATDAEPVLRDAIREAGEPWLRALEPVYAALREAIGNDSVFGPKIRGWEAQWRRRVADKRWPEFLVSRAELWDRS